MLIWSTFGANKIRTNSRRRPVKCSPRACDLTPLDYEPNAFNINSKFVQLISHLMLSFRAPILGRFLELIVFERGENICT